MPVAQEMGDASPYLEVFIFLWVGSTKFGRSKIKERFVNLSRVLRARQWSILDRERRCCSEDRGGSCREAMGNLEQW